MAKEYFMNYVLPKVMRLAETQTQQFLTKEDLERCKDLTKTTKSNMIITCDDYCVVVNKSFMITSVQHKKMLLFPMH